MHTIVMLCIEEYSLEFTSSRFFTVEKNIIDIDKLLTDSDSCHQGDPTSKRDQFKVKRCCYTAQPPPPHLYYTSSICHTTLYSVVVLLRYIYY